MSNASFLRLAYNKKAEAEGRDELDPLEFDDFIQEKIKGVKMDSAFLDRSLNEGFSGGEKKRNEILQMSVLEPKLAILDELDSGLDIDALRVLGEAVNRQKAPERALLLITHFPRILETIHPDQVHVLSGGRIVKSGGMDLAMELEERGYDWVRKPGGHDGRTHRLQHPAGAAERPAPSGMGAPPEGGGDRPGDPGTAHDPAGGLEIHGPEGLARDQLRPRAAS